MFRFTANHCRFASLLFITITLISLCANSGFVAAAAADDDDGKHCNYGELLCDLFSTTSLTSDWVDSYRDPIQPVDGIPVAFGDINSDHLVDVLFIANDTKSIEILQGRNCVDGQTILTYFGSRNCLSRNTDFKCTFQFPVVNVVVSDFSGFNHPDLLITLRKDKEKEVYEVHLVHGSLNIHDINCSASQLLFENVSAEPFVLDYNGDMVSDFIVPTPNCTTMLWVGGRTSEETNYEDIHLGASVEKMRRLLAPLRKEECLKNLTDQHLKVPHSSAFVNLNSLGSDMTPDIFIDGKEYIEYVYNVPQSGFTQKVLYDLPKQTVRGQSFFIDMDYNGRLEHVIPVCLDEKANNFDDCQNLGLMALNCDKKEWENLLDGSDFVNKSLTFANVHTRNLDIPVIMRVADLDYDGYPDLVTVVKDRTTSKTYGAVLINKKVSNDNGNSFKRYFKLEWTSADIEKEDNVIVMALFDIYNNGLLNLMITKQTSNGRLDTYSYDYFTNHKQSKYYSFLRISIISGRCSNKAPHLEQCPNTDSLAFGTGPPGVMACFDGPYNSQHTCAAQLSQSTHFSLQLPYMVFGLGDVLNVIKDLKVSIANGPSDSRKGQWEENIPGSNLVVVPYPPNNPKKWDLRIFINMSIYSLISLAFLIVTGIVLSIAIYVLYRFEVHEDRSDKIPFF